jgi:hypothetical protein
MEIKVRIKMYQFNAATVSVISIGSLYTAICDAYPGRQPYLNHDTAIRAVIQPRSSFFSKRRVGWFKTEAEAVCNIRLPKRESYRKRVSYLIDNIAGNFIIPTVYEGLVSIFDLMDGIDPDGFAVHMKNVIFQKCVFKD